MSDNTAVDGGGISGGDIVLENATVSGNRAYSVGGGISNPGGGATVISSTISGNSAFNGGGLFTRDGGTVTLENSILAGNSSEERAPDLENYNGTSTIVVAGANLIGGDPMLAPLGLYGGSTATAPPMLGSPALDSGIPTANTPATDQRDLPRIAGDGLDIGAYETGNAAGYAAWAAETILPGLDASFAGDADLDGVSNGVTYGAGAGGSPVIVLKRGGAEISFGYRPEAEVDLIWKVFRSTDLRTFEEILRIEGGIVTSPPGVSLPVSAPPTLTLLDESPPSGAGQYRLGAELATPQP